MMRMLIKRKGSCKPSFLFISLLTMFASLYSCKEDNCTVLFNALDLPPEIEQAVLVSTPDWDGYTGDMSWFSRTKAGWRAVRGEFPVAVGRNGLGWGLGLFTMGGETGPVKVEGDGKSPAGIFRLGYAFGYSGFPPEGCKLPYRTATDRDYFVDAVNSPDYNTWVSLVGVPNEPEKHWKSFEKMRRDDSMYELGIIVEHNVRPVIPGRGSAIFLHVWSAKGEPTSGCTAMSKKGLKSLLVWLDPCKNPVLIQIPEPELRNLPQWKGKGAR
jgi:L,D-peptidoglycan transpeptidase YkuD (ErfK/YbiS/YcfS/YnhG family)